MLYNPRLFIDYLWYNLRMQGIAPSIFRRRMVRANMLIRACSTVATNSEKPTVHIQRDDDRVVNSMVMHTHVTDLVSTILSSLPLP